MNLPRDFFSPSSANSKRNVYCLAVGGNELISPNNIREHTRDSVPLKWDESATEFRAEAVTRVLKQIAVRAWAHTRTQEIRFRNMAEWLSVVFRKREVI